MSAINGPVGGVIGAPIGVPAGSGIGFNEVIAAYGQNVNVATVSTLDITIPFGFGSPAELDLVVLLNSGGSADSFCNIFSGSPNGLLARFGPSLDVDNTDYRTIQLIGNILRITTFGAATVVGRIQILRRNRRVRTYTALAVSTTETALPFAIKDVRRAMLTNNTGSQLATGVRASAFLNEYIPLADSNSWHFGPFGGGTKVRITSATTYITTSGGTALILTEFE